MRVERRGDEWAVLDGERVLATCPTNAAAWRYIDGLERREVWCRNATAVTHNAFRFDRDA